MKVHFFAFAASYLGVAANAALRGADDSFNLEARELTPIVDMASSGDWYEINQDWSQSTGRPRELKEIDLGGGTAQVVALSGTYSKKGNRRTCAWDRCPSAGFPWNKQLGEGCSCSNGMNTCYFDGEATTTVNFDQAKLLPLDNGIWKMESNKADSELDLGQGKDCASGSKCFDDSLRGGFRVDLTGTGYQFDSKSKVILKGWSPQMRVMADGVEVSTAGANANAAEIPLGIPEGTKVVEAVCGGWCGGCTSELFVRKEPVVVTLTGTYSKSGNRRTCAWDRCPSAGFPWNKQLGEGCSCSNGMNTCHLNGEATTTVKFDQAKLLPLGNGILKMEANTANSELALGQGKDCASGSKCFDDSLRGGFRVDLTGTGYQFDSKSKVILKGWSPQMKVTADGVVVDTVGANAKGAEIPLAIPEGTKVVEAVCGGWCGGCTSELFVRKEPTVVALTGTYSKSGNRRTCAWDRCPSAGFPWNQQLGEGCTCSKGMNTCYLDGEATTTVNFDQAKLLPVDNGIWKMEANTADSELALGQGKDCASGSKCFDDSLRGGFRVDLTGTGYQFDTKSTVVLKGWSPQMRVKADGVVVDTVGANANSAEIPLGIPEGTEVVEVECGGWCGGCTSELFVMKKV